MRSFILSQRRDLNENKTKTECITNRVSCLAALWHDAQHLTEVIQRVEFADSRHLADSVATRLLVNKLYSLRGVTSPFWTG